MVDRSAFPMNRRHLMSMIGAAAGGTVMYQAMTSLGYAAESNYSGPIKLEGDPKGASVLILGAGVAGMCAAIELRKAGYKVQILEYNDRPGGRVWSVRGGDTYTELGGFRQTAQFDKGLYLNPGPWRIPFHHKALLDYCSRFGVALEPFMQVNDNAYIHSSQAFDGKPQRFRHIESDFHGNVAELLAKATSQNKLDQSVTKEDAEILLDALRQWGALNKNYEYRQGELTSDRRGYDVDPGGGLAPEAVPSKPIGFSELLNSRLWSNLTAGAIYEWNPTMFQPIGGMDMIAKAFAREVGPNVIRYNSKVTSIKQDGKGVSVTYQDAKAGGAAQQAHGDYCICTIPLSILSQIEIDVGAPMRNAINAVSYAPSVKIGLQFKRRFWEQDEAIYGGITYTDLPINLISYPSTDYGSRGKGVLLGAFEIFGRYGFEFAAMTPEERIKVAVEQGAQIHPQYKTEFENGFSVAWHRVPFTLGCFGLWTEETQKEHYANLCAIDGRIVLAGEHASHLAGWQEGALLSSLDAMTRLHQRVLAG